VENRLSDLWSIFDFTHPGLLGSERAFAHFAKRLGETGQYAPLRSLVAPYILRRLKSDKRIIADLPDKTEVSAWCSLSAVQATHYQQAVKALEQALDKSGGHGAQGPGALVLDAIEANLQPSLAMAGRRRLGARGQWQVCAPA
jgi:non-specific serine/threonine protein kinase